MFRRPIFWIVLCIASGGSILFAARYFSRAFPIVTLDLRMNREQALARSAELAARLQLPPSGYRQVASFAGDQETQNFVELEAGGTGAFQAMMAEGLYYPFTWKVRHFTPGETRETLFRFTPRGDPYGFFVKLPEKEAGAALEADPAREIAEKSAMRDWQVELGKFRVVEQSREVRPGGRIDHTFVYERPDIQVGEGRYRLRLIVAGDKLTGLAHYVKIPEAFSRRYEQMRSSNDVVGAAGTIALAVFYFVGGCGIGLFFLLRQRWILWRTPLFWGLFISFLQLLGGINQWPLIWMSYDTAISASGFVLQQILMLLLSFLGYAALFTVSFMAAESLTRRAFPHHIQLWKLWSGDVAGSKAVLGRTLGGYLLVGIFFAYEVLLYFVASRALGWWTPSDALVQPDVLATYFPWLTAIADSAQAGFWEESLFRAVPIAGAALLGNRFGRRTWWIGGALIVQAFIFGSGHAAYATQPFYARVVELIIPSLMFAGLYLVFGLLPAIILHFTFDTVWFALPLFVSAAPGIWVNRILVIALALVPLWIVLGARWRAGRWREISETDFNSAWRPPEAAVLPVVEEQPVARAMSPASVRLLLALGALGLLLWFWATNFRPDGPPLTTNRSEATDIAKRALEQRGVHLSASWKVLTAIQGQPSQQDRFIWQTEGKDMYRRLMNEYLTPPLWRVRFAQFEGDIVERAEEYQVFVSNAGRVYRFKHMLPEARPGNSISEDKARSLALEAVKQEFQIDPAAVKEISAVPSKLKARTDWLFTFTAGGEPKLSQGERRIGVGISGDQVTDVYRFVHVPEEWDRQERDRQTIPAMLGSACSIALVAIVGAGMIAAIVSWSRKRFIVSTFVLVSLLLLGLNVTTFLNSIPSLSFQFLTAQPFRVQLFILLGVGAIGIVFAAAGLGLTAGLVHRWRMEDKSMPVTSWLIGLSLGSFAAGLSALGSSMSPSLAPRWANYGVMNSYIPLLGMILAPAAGYLLESITILLIFTALNRFTNHWSMKKIPSCVLLIALGFAIAGSGSVETLSSWLLQGVIIGCMLLACYLLVLRFCVEVSLIAVGVVVVFSLLKQAVAAAYPMILPGTLLALTLVAVTVWAAYRRVADVRRFQGAPPDSSAV